MSYAKVKNGVCEIYPYDFAALQADNPHTNYGNNRDVAYWFPQTEEAMKGYELVQITPTKPPIFDLVTQKLEEALPQLIDDGWQQAWNVIDLSPEEVSQRRDKVRQDNKSEAERLLVSTDWSVLPDVDDTTNSIYLSNKDEFLAYRAALRAIAVNPPDTLDVVWPTPPQEKWVSND